MDSICCFTKKEYNQRGEAMSDKIEELIEDFEITINMDEGDGTRIKEVRSALLSEYRRMESELASQVSQVDEANQLDDFVTSCIEYSDGKLSSLEVVRDIYKRLHDTINELLTEREAHRWIPVSERLPEEKKVIDYVLVIEDCGYITKARYSHTYTQWHDGDGVTLNYVTHWKPLPAAPESEENHGRK
jgi:hypothetical protein